MQNLTETSSTESDTQSSFPAFNWLLTTSGDLGSMLLPPTEELNTSSSDSGVPTAVIVDPIANTVVNAIPVVPAETMDRGNESSPNAQRDQRTDQQQPKRNEKRGCCESCSGCCDACYCPRTNTTFIYIDSGSSSGDGDCCFNFCKGVLDGFNQMICCPVETVKSCATNPPPCHLTDCCCLFQPVESPLGEPLSGMTEASTSCDCVDSCGECLNACCEGLSNC
ncbi:MAG: hypothetical protein CMF55_05440 [Legionellales bacterium]|nr:hypothetical protein [Legionellales bacterium]